jgi:hypothetical protein
MSWDLHGGINYALTKRHYDADDYVAIPFGPTQDYYVVGTMAYMNDPNVADFERGWCLFAHGQPAAPAFLAPVLAALGLTWPSQTPAFEAKDILFYATQDCYIRFEGSSRVQHYIPANTFMRFHRRCLMFFVQQVSASGTLMAWIEG